MSQYNIPLALPYFNEEELNAVKNILESRWVSQGPATESFEKEFAAVMGSEYAVALNSATSGLYLSLLALGIKKGDDVLVSDFTFPASDNAILYSGANPIPLDVDINTFNIVPEEIEKKITKNTRAIMPVYALGNPPDIYEIMKIAEKQKISVVEDSACAHGSNYKDKMAGTFGDVGVFSFHGRKILSTGEGGMAVTNSELIFKDLKSLRSHGMILSALERSKADDFILPQFLQLGYNNRMSDINAAIGHVQLKRLKDFLKKRQTMAKIYNDLIQEYHLPLIPQKVLQDASHNYQTYAVRCESRKIRDMLIMKLKKVGIGSTIGTYSLSALPLFKGNVPNSKRLFETTLALPMYHELTEEKIKIVIKEIRVALRKKYKI